MEKRIISGEKEICEWLGVNNKAFRKLREAGLPHAHLCGRLWINVDEVSQWFREQCRAHKKEGEQALD